MLSRKGLNDMDSHLHGRREGQCVMTLSGDRAEGGSRELGLYQAFLSLRLGLTKPRFRQEDNQLLSGEGQEPHETTLF